MQGKLKTHRMSQKGFSKPINISPSKPGKTNIGVPTNSSHVVLRQPYSNITGQEQEVFNVQQL